jgi:hypothetical protein
MPDLSSWSDAALSAEVIARAAEAERANARLAEVTAVWLARGAWGEAGSHSPTAWLVEHTSMTRPKAARTCATARLVHAHPRTAAALEAGDATIEHVEVLAAAVRRRESLYSEHEDTLLDAAKTLNPDDFVTVAKRWRALADDELAAIDAAAAYEQRYLRVSPTIGGAHIDGFLDAVGAATVVKALDALSPPDPSSDPAPRSLSVRYADAFVMMAEASLGDPERGGAAQANVDKPGAAVQASPRRPPRRWLAHGARVRRHAHHDMDEASAPHPAPTTTIAIPIPTRTVGLVG